jgi:hypothetical protein
MKVRDAFAWPFKTLRDAFTNPPSVPDPEFTRLDLDALQTKDPEGNQTPQPRPVQALRGKIRIPLLLLFLVAILIALILLGQ